MNDVPPSATNEKPSWADSPATPKRIFYFLLVSIVLLILSDFAYHKHTNFSFEESLGFHAFFGFLAYVTIVNSAKLLRKIVKRPEDYYDE